MALLDISDNLRAKACEEIGHDAGQLRTPLTGYSLWPGSGPFAVDNGAFSRFDAAAFLRLLARLEPHKARCLFVAVPDVVGSARRTLEAFRHWAPLLAGWPLALVAQNGVEDLDIPWADLAAVFVGGDDRFKDGPDAIAVVKCAKLLGKHAHVGRVNGAARWLAYEAAGCDTADGSGLCKYTDRRHAIRDRHGRRDNGQMGLWSPPPETAAAAEGTAA